MALNDWADRAADARGRPGRPIPSGAVPAAAALALALGLLAAGPLLAYAGAGPRAAAWAGGLALLAALYDVAGRGPWRGPALLAACRAGNLALGAAALGASSPLVSSACGLYALYVFSVSRLGRLEDGEDGGLESGRPGRWILLLAALLALVPLVPVHGPTPGGRALAAAVAWSGAAGLVRVLRARSGPWTRGEVVAAMGLALRRLLVMTAAFACLAWGATGPDPRIGGGAAALVVAAAILCGYPVAHALRRVFPPS